MTKNISLIFIFCSTSQFLMNYFEIDLPEIISDLLYVIYFGILFFAFYKIYKLFISLRYLYNKDKEITEVIFRKENNGDVIAAFFYLSYRRGWQTTFYAHIGQHGWGYLDIMLRSSRAATPEEYADLKAELESIGYNLRVIKKPCHRKMYAL